jgi:RHS repeat-associated protein
MELLDDPLAQNGWNELTNSGYADDANGNQTAGPAIGANPTSFTYNAKDQTSNLTRNGANDNATYLGQGQADMTVKGSTLYHNDVIGMSIRNGSTTIDAFTRTPDGQPIDQRMKNKSDGAINRYYYLLDGLGSIVALTDSAGGTAMPLPATYKYDPYGNDAGSTGTIVSRLRFAGGYLSTSLGLYKFGERWYDPTTGRWQQQDLLEDPLAQKGWNRYDYAGDDPVNYTDRDGRRVEPAPCWRADAVKGYCSWGTRGGKGPGVHPVRRAKAIVHSVRRHPDKALAAAVGCYLAGDFLAFHGAATPFPVAGAIAGAAVGCALGGTAGWKGAGWNNIVRWSK